MVYLRHVDRRPAGFITVTGLDGKTLFEGGLRQCIHCQFTWTHKPGSGIVRGFCLLCGGHVCGKPQCDTCYHKEKQIEDTEAIARGNRASINAAVRRQALREQIAGYLKKKPRKGRRP